MHDASLGQVLDGPQHAPHVVLDLCRGHLGEVRLEGLAFLVAKDEGDLAFEAEALDQLGDVVPAVEVLEDQHLNQNERGIDGREYPLYGILLDFAIHILVERVLIIMVLGLR